MTGKISIIMPAYNAEKYIQDAIQSVIEQSHENWELLIVNDGSKDNTYEKIQNFHDNRIRYFEQENQGVSAARNKALTHMRGDYFCFLDADDLLTKHSLSSRIKAFDHPDSPAYVTGGQEQRSNDLSQLINRQFPDYHGLPRTGLIAMDEKCFINCGTWLIKNDASKKYQFFEEMTHSEDLAFFLSISNQGLLTSIREIVQLYRRHDQSAMTSLLSLEKGYVQFYRYANSGGYLQNRMERIRLILKIRKIMILSYLSVMNLKRAILIIFKKFRV